MTWVAPQPRARRSRWRLILGLIVAVALLVVGIVVLRHRQPVDDLLVGPAASPSPAWRTDYFRNVQVRVPATWGYALDIENTWCAAGDPLPSEYRHPYVAMSNPGAGAAVDCISSIPAELVQEHLSFVAGPFGDQHPTATTRQDGFWVLTRQVDDVLATLWIRDRAIGQEIIASLTHELQPIRTGCAPHHVVQKDSGAEPDQPFDLATIDPVQAVAICQYDIGSAGGLRARAVLVGDEAARLVAELRNGPAGAATRCLDPALQRTNLGALALVLRLDTGTAVHDLHVFARHCSKSGIPDTRFSLDGQTPRGFSLGTCTRLLVPPVAAEFAIAYTGQSCS